MPRVLPTPPPYRISALFYTRQRGALGLAVVGLLISAFVVWLAADDARRVGKERRIWADGVPAQGVEVTGRETTKYGVWHSAKLHVRFSDVMGNGRDETVEFDALGILDVDQRAPAELRYLASEPGAVALSWAVAAGPNRLAFSLLLALIGVAGTVGCALALRRARKRARAVEACARNGREIRLEVVRRLTSVSHGVESVEYRLRWKTATGGWLNLSFPDQFGPPVFLNAECSEVLGLWSRDAPDDPVVICANGMPFEPEHRPRP